MEAGLCSPPVIDLHSHVLPGLDDGAQGLDGALAMLAEMEADGVRMVAGTPHVRHDYPTTPEGMVAAVRELRVAARDAGCRIEVVPGGELSLSVVDESSPEELQRFALGGRSHAILVEFPYADWPYLIEKRVARLVERGLTPVLAHPERNERVAAEPGLLRPAADAGALVQVTAGSLTGVFGRRASRCARELLALGLVHLVGSDAHGPHLPRAGLRAAVEALEDARLGRWLTEDVPAAILTDGALPPRPRSRRSPRRLPFRRV